MNTGITKVVEEISHEIVLLAQQIMDDDSIAANPKTGKNTLKDSLLKSNIRSSVTIGDNIVIETFFDNYIEFIENGRAPGTMPPVSALREWALRRNIPADNDTLFAIATAIKRDGYEGRPILATLDREIESRFESEWYDKIFEVLTAELTEYFLP